MVWDPITRVSRNRKKLRISSISARFRGLKHTILGVPGGFKRPRTTSHEFHEIGKKLMISGISGRFRGLQHSVLGSGVDLNGPGPRHTSFTKS